MKTETRKTTRTHYLQILTLAFMLMAIPCRADDPPVIPPVAPAVPAESTPPAAPTGETPTEPVVPPEDTLLNVILRDLKPPQEPKVDPPIEPAPEPPVVPPVVPPVAPATPVVPPVVEPKPKPKITKATSPSKGHPLLEPVPSAPVAQTPPPPPAPDLDQNLTDDQREEIQEAIVAERLFPGRKGYAKQVKDWYPEFERKARALQDRKPDITEDDEEYQSLLRSKPTLSRQEVKKVQRAIGQDESVREAQKAVAPQLEEVRMTAKRAEIAPQVKEFVKVTYPQAVIKLAEQEGDASPIVPVIKMMREKGADAAREEYPLEMSVMAEVSGRYAAMTEEFLYLRNGAKALDQNNPTHLAVSEFIRNEGQAYAKNAGNVDGKNLLIDRDGRRFLTREDFNRVVMTDPNERATYDPNNWRTGKFWTFTDTAITDMLAHRTNSEIKNRVSGEQKRIESYGYKRQPKSTVAKTQPAPTEITAPKSVPTIAPGGGGGVVKSTVSDDSPIPIASIAARLKRKI